MERKTPKASFGFPREARITRGSELQRIAREGKRIRTDHIEVRAAASPLARPLASGPSAVYVGLRVGLVVPRFKHSAVARNRLKRRLRELARLRILPAGMRADIVIRIRPDAYAASFEALERDVQRAMQMIERWHASVNTQGDV